MWLRGCDEARPGQILISPRVLMEVEEPSQSSGLANSRSPLAAYNVVAARSTCEQGPTRVVDPRMVARRGRNPGDHKSNRARADIKRDGRRAFSQTRHCR